MYTMRAANTCGGERYVEAERGAMCLGKHRVVGRRRGVGGGGINLTACAIDTTTSRLTLVASWAERNRRVQEG